MAKVYDRKNLAVLKKREQMERVQFKASDLLKPGEEMPKDGVRVLTFGDPYPTPKEVAETMKDPNAGIIGRLYGFQCAEEVGCGSTDPQKISKTPYSGDAGDETE